MKVLDLLPSFRCNSELRGKASRRLGHRRDACRASLVHVLAWFGIALLLTFVIAEGSKNVSAETLVRQDSRATVPQSAVIGAKGSMVVANHAGTPGMFDLPEYDFLHRTWDRNRNANELTAFQMPAAPDDTLPEPPPAAPAVIPLVPEIRIPLSPEELRDRVSVAEQDGRIALKARDAPLADVLNVLIDNRGLNLVIAPDANQSISVNLPDVTFDEAFNALVRSANCTWSRTENVVYVTRVAAQARPDPASQERQVRVFRLNFMTAIEMEKIVKGLLSPIGQAFPNSTSPTDSRKAQESIVVEDLPNYLARIEQCVASLDQAPSQVLVEVHVLQVALGRDTKCGVNLQAICESLGTKISIKSIGFANQTATQGVLINVDSKSYSQIVECLLTTTNSKTLASPKISAVNGQEANMQIGSKLGYFVSSTSVGTTIQSVNFLEVGVVLKVTPFITEDGRILMTVSPKVSTGQVSDTGLPTEKTTQLSTTALLENEHGMIIGGLINEEDTDSNSKVPLLGDLWLVGKLFQKRATTRTRNEIIIALIPRIAPHSPDYVCYEQMQYQHALTPLLDNSLNPTDRPWDCRFHDPIHNPWRWRRKNRQPSQPFPTPPQAPLSGSILFELPGGFSDPLISPPSEPALTPSKNEPALR